MRHERGRTRAAIGFTVKSGWACAVLLTGPAGSPRVLDSRRIDLSDPALPESRQPYHAGFGTARAASPELSRLVGAVKRFGRQSVTDAIRRYRAAGHPVRGAGVVVGSLSIRRSSRTITSASTRSRASCFAASFRRRRAEAGCRARSGASATFTRRQPTSWIGRNARSEMRSWSSDEALAARGVPSRKRPPWLPGSSWPDARPLVRQSTAWSQQIAVVVDRSRVRALIAGAMRHQYMRLCLPGDAFR